MIKELIIKDKAITKQELKKYLFSASGEIIDNICLPVGFFHIFPELRDYTNNVALIDYPTGWNNKKFRLREIDYAIKCGVVAVDLTINNLLLADKDYVGISKEVESCVSLCKASDIPLRCIIEYRLFDEKEILHLCTILSDLGVEAVVTSTGTMPDDAIDNIIIGANIKRETGMNVISCGIARSHNEYDLMNVEHLYGIRFVSVQGATYILGHLL